MAKTIIFYVNLEEGYEDDDFDIGVAKQSLLDNIEGAAYVGVEVEDR